MMGSNTPGTEILSKTKVEVVPITPAHSPLENKITEETKTNPRLELYPSWYSRKFLCSELVSTDLLENKHIFPADSNTPQFERYEFNMIITLGTIVTSQFAIKLDKSWSEVGSFPIHIL